ncbi:uncharacterized protein BX663DRAFT_212809 [Cokeromyces recurvatus]|uniref:uncharacterized protein n=1 Tax=Cokeromyces recurvatus TaxID=90255 RepID=UPI00221ED71E|nr:uncharacterized protein BX663DRAFT_212809 [Cokeromyces recurvatus]KAI7899379.1 hypothetical protein BX663DRAFT_212809 [Cokeromyces recurvatus]
MMIEVLAYADQDRVSGKILNKTPPRPQLLLLEWKKIADRKKTCFLLSGVDTALKPLASKKTAHSSLKPINVLKGGVPRVSTAYLDTLSENGINLLIANPKKKHVDFNICWVTQPPLYSTVLREKARGPHVRFNSLFLQLEKKEKNDSLRIHECHKHSCGVHYRLKMKSRKILTMETILNYQ